MQVDEIKLRIAKYTNVIIQKIFPEDDVFNKIKIAALEYWVKQNTWRLDNILNNFVDRNGEIDINDAVDFFSDSIFDANGLLSINIQEKFQGNMVAKYLPDKIILFTKEDLYNMFGIIHENNRVDRSNLNGND